MTRLQYDITREEIGRTKEDKYLLLIIRIMLIAWIAMKIMSWKLWLADRSFPLAPLISFPQPVHLILFSLFFIFSILLFIRPLKPVFIGCLLFAEVISLLGDQLRWHPWEYQFLFIFLAVMLSRGNSRSVINSIIFIFASSYFFSGISKLNSDFLQNIWLQIMLVKILHFPKAVYYNSLVRYAGLLIPLFEISCGVLILLRKHYKVTPWLPIALHILIIAYVSPLLFNYDYIVLPWNVFMLSTVYLLFVRSEIFFSAKDLFSKGNIVIASAWILLPIVGLFGYWPPFFSFKLYTGIPISLVIYVPDKTSVPADVKPYLKNHEKGYEGLHTYFRPFDWCNDEMMVPIPPQMRIYKQLQDSLEERYGAQHFVFHYY